MRRAMILLLLVGCEKPLSDQLRGEGYMALSAIGGGNCGDDDFEEGYEADRGGHRWQIVKCCHTTLQVNVHPCGKSTCTNLVPVKHCNRLTTDLGPLTTEAEDAR